MCTLFAQRGEAEADPIELPPMRDLSLNSILRSAPQMASSPRRACSGLGGGGAFGRLPASADTPLSFFDNLLLAASAHVDPTSAAPGRLTSLPGLHTLGPDNFFAPGVLGTLEAGSAPLAAAAADHATDSDPDAERPEAGFAAMQHDVVALGLAGATEDPPPFSYAAMTCHAIMCCGTTSSAGAGAMLTSTQIYQAIMAQFGYYRTKRDNGWRQTVRSTLSANPSFTKHRVATTGRGVTYAWRVDGALARKHIKFGRVRRRHTRTRSPCGKASRK